MGEQNMLVLGRHHRRRRGERVSAKGLGSMHLGKSVGAAVTAIVLAVTVLPACTGSPASDPSSTPTPASADPTTAPAESPTASPTPTSDTDIAAAAAGAVLRDYLTLSNQLRTNPDMPLDSLDDVTTSVERDSQTKFLSEWRDKGWTTTGAVEVADLELVDVSLDNSDPDGGSVPTVTFEVCQDASDTDVVDTSGTSVVAPDRPDRSWTRYLVSNYRWDDDPGDAWRVASSETLEREPCDAA